MRTTASRERRKRRERGSWGGRLTLDPLPCALPSVVHPHSSQSIASRISPLQTRVSARSLACAVRGGSESPATRRPAPPPSVARWYLVPADDDDERDVEGAGKREPKPALLLTPKMEIYGHGAVGEEGAVDPRRPGGVGSTAGAVAESRRAARGASEAAAAAARAAETLLEGMSGGAIEDDDAVEARAALETRRARDAAAAARQGRETMDADMTSRVEARRRRRGAPGVGMMWPRGMMMIIVAA